MPMKDLIAASLLLAAAGSAAAVDPQCESAVAADPGSPYNAFDGIELCTPLLDGAGIPLEAGELTRCTVRIDGQPYVVLNTTTPGSYFNLPGPTTGPKRGALDAFCEGDAGAGQPTATYDAFLRRAKPGKPIVR